MEIQVEAAETAKVSYGKIAQHEIRTANGHELTRRQKEKTQPQMHADLVS
ncbi:MAG: hypothetical protein WBZ19_00705 [Chthoniobacterales bacterium]